MPNARTLFEAMLITGAWLAFCTGPSSFVPEEFLTHAVAAVLLFLARFTIEWPLGPDAASFVRIAGGIALVYILIVAQPTAPIGAALRAWFACLTVIVIMKLPVACGWYK